MEELQNTVQKFLHYLSERDLKHLIALFSDTVDWYIPGDEEKAAWLGRRRTRQEISDFYGLLWQQTEPVSANIDTIYFNGGNAVIAGEFATKMLRTGKTVSSLFFIQMTVKNGEIIRYRLLEDSYAVSRALD